MINIADLKDPNDPQGRTYREINNETNHKFNIGDLVEWDDGVRLYVAKLTRDCDGTPLCSLTPEKDDIDNLLDDYRSLKWVHCVNECYLKLVRRYDGN